MEDLKVIFISIDINF